MPDEVNKEFKTYRDLFETDAEKQAFDKPVTDLLEKHGVDYLRGYVAALRSGGDAGVQNTR
jgi:hypothetical protein